MLIGHDISKEQTKTFGNDRNRVAIKCINYNSSRTQGPTFAGASFLQDHRPHPE